MRKLKSKLILPMRESGTRSQSTIVGNNVRIMQQPSAWFQPVSPISYSTSRTPRATTGRRRVSKAQTQKHTHTQTSRRVHTYIHAQLIIFSHFSTEIILETNGPFKARDWNINLASKMAKLSVARAQIDRAASIANPLTPVSLSPHRMSLF